MTIQERINRFCAKYPTAQQTTVEFTWKRSDGEHKQTLCGDGRPYLSTSISSKPLYMIQFNYDDETELFEMSYITLSRKTPRFNDDRKWELSYRYFIPKEEKVVYNIDGSTNSYRYYKSNGTIETNKSIELVKEISHCYSTNFTESFGALTDNNPDLPPRFANNEYWCSPSNYRSWLLPTWFTHKIQKTNNKKQNLKESIFNKTLDNIDMNWLQQKFSEYKNDNPNIVRIYWNSYPIAIYDGKSNTIRAFSCYISDNQNYKIVETSRIYYINRKFVGAQLSRDKWRQQPITHSSFSHNLLNMSDLVNQKSKYKYLSDIMPSYPTIYNIVSALKNREIEQLCNMGCEPLAACICDTNVSTLAMSNKLTGIFGDTVMPTSKSICKKYGVSNKQIRSINEIAKTASYSYSYYNRNNNNIKHYLSNVSNNIKQIYGLNKLNEIGDLFDQYYSVFSLSNMTSCVEEIINRLLPNGHYYGHIDYLENNQNITLGIIFNKLLKIYSKDEQYHDVFTTYLDTLRLYQMLRTESRNALDVGRFSNYNDILTLHNRAIDLYNIQREEDNRLSRMREEERNKELEIKMVKIDKERSKYNYEDDKFIIKLPEHLSEIIKEGGDLHHCVGGYTRRHATGETTILFLRDKSNIDKAFYTIEVKDSQVIQIHGFGNKWLGNNPEAIPTVYKWVKLHNLKCSDAILRSTSTSYCGNNNLVAMPTID